MNKVYSRINWENEPSTKTPLNEHNLNKIDFAVDEIDNRVIELDSTKAKNTDLQTLSTRVDNLILNAGDSSAECTDARVTEDGTTYDTLKKRLDAEHSSVIEDISQLSNDISNVSEMGNVRVNLFDYSNVLHNTAIPQGNFNYITETFEAPDNSLSNIIDVIEGETYNFFMVESGNVINYLHYSLYISFADANKKIIETISIPYDEKASVIAPTEAKFMRFQYKTHYEENTIMVVQGDYIPNTFYSHDYVISSGACKHLMHDKKKNPLVDNEGHYYYPTVTGVTNCTVADTPIYKLGDINSNTKIRFNNNNGEHAIAKLDLNGALFEKWETIGIMVYINSQTFNKLRQINIYLGNGNDTDYTTKPMKFFHYANLRVGWNYLTWGNFEFSMNNVLTNSRTCDRLFIEFEARVEVVDNTDIGEIIIDAIVLNRKLKPTIFISHDGMWETSRDSGLYDYYINNNIPCSIYWKNWDVKSTDSSELVEIAKTLHSHGCKLGIYGSYGEDNLPIQYGTDWKTMVENAINNRNALENIIGEEVIGYAFSQAISNGMMISALKQAGFKIGRDGVNVHNTGYFDKDIFAIGMYTCANDTTFEAVKSKIDDTIQYGRMLSIFTHATPTENPDTYECQYSVWKEIIDYLITLRDNGDIILTTHEDYYKMDER